MSQTTRDSVGNKTETETDVSIKRKRLNLDLTPAAYKLLQDLASESGRSMTDILRIGLALVGIAQEEATRGRSLGVIEGEKVIKEIVLPS